MVCKDSRINQHVSQFHSEPGKVTCFCMLNIIELRKYPHNKEQSLMQQSITAAKFKLIFIDQSAAGCTYFSC